MKEYNIQELAVDRVVPTGEIGVEYAGGSWQRNGQRLLCPLSLLILQKQPSASSSWLRAASMVTGWTLTRTMAFKLQMGRMAVRGTDAEARKGVLDAKLYNLLHKLSRHTNRGVPVSRGA